jgi:hypothetical protein
MISPYKGDSQVRKFLIQDQMTAGSRPKKFDIGGNFESI